MTVAEANIVLVLNALERIFSLDHDTFGFLGFVLVCVIAYKVIVKGSRDRR